MWTDEDMPTNIGVPMHVTAYGSTSRDYSRECKHWTIQVEVMRCSLIDHDFIYRYISSNVYNNYYPNTCGSAFCGMI